VINALKQVAARILRCRKVIVGGVECSGSTVVYQYLKEMGFEPMKAHDYLPYGRIKFVTYRDPRDVLCSYARRQFRHVSEAEGVEAGLVAGHQELFRDHARAETIRRYRGDPRSVMIRYEDYFGGKEDEMLRLVARHMGVSLTDEQVRRIVEKYSLEQNKARAAQRRDFTQYDRETGIHGNHISTNGRTGVWKELFTPKVREMVKADIGDLIVELGYEKDTGW